MQLNFLVIAILLLFFYLGFTRGFFSMLLHLGAVIAAGAIALSVWEPLAYMIIEKFDGEDWIMDCAYGAALAIPFALSLSIILGTLTAVVRSNVHVPAVANYIGGASLGIVAGIIVTGIATISVGFVRGHTDLTGFTPIVGDSSGSLTRTGGGLWVPVDHWTASAYKFMSQGTLSTSTPLALYYPDLADRPHLQGNNPDNAILKIAIPPKAASVIGRYTLNEGNGKLKYDDLVTDTRDARKQLVKNLDGEDYRSRIAETGEFYVEGFVVDYKSAATEKLGQIAAGPGGVTLIVKDENGDASAIQPFALVSQAQTPPPEQGKPANTNVIFSRWRFDAKGTFLGSVGGRTDSTPMGYEFLVQKNQIPVAIYVRGLRFDLLEEDGVTEKVKTPADKKFANAAARDMMVPDGSILAATSGDAKFDDSQAVDIAWSQDKPQSWLMVGTQLPFSISLNKGDLSFEFDGTRIKSGEQTLSEKELNNRVIDRDLRVDGFATDGTTAICQLDLTGNSPVSMLTAAASAATGSPVLVASNGQKFSCVGYVYRDGSKGIIRYTPGSTISDMNTVPSMTKSRTDQKLKLVFRVTAGVKIVGYAIGNTMIANFKPPVQADATR